MDRSLFLLSKLRFYGGLRKLKRAVATPKGVLLVLFALAMFSMMVLPSLLMRHVAPPGVERPRFDGFFRPATLFGFWVASALGGNFKSPLAFTLAEVEFLFSGPFTRRQLLAQKLLVAAVGALGLAIMAPLFIFAYVSVWWPAALVGIWWTVCFVQMSIILMTLAGNWIGQRFRRWRALLAAVLALLMGMTLWQAGILDEQVDFFERLQALESTWTAQVVLAPFAVFNRLIFAATAGEFFTWATAALALNLAVVAGILLLDADFMEASLLASQRRYDWMERAKRGGGMPAIGMRSTPRLSLPQFPRLRGAGPIAWRQMLQLMRGSGRLIFIAPALLGPFIAVAVRKQGPETIAGAFVIGVIVIVGYFVTTVMPLGLRTDLDHVDTIKTLPIGSGAILWGSLSAALMYTTLMQWAIAAMLIALGGGWTPLVMAALASAVPFNLLFIGFDSILVLLYPSTRRFDPGDVLVGVRVMLLSVAKMLFVMLLGGIAAFYVFVAYAFVGEEPVALFLTGWIVLVGEGLVTVWLAGLLFGKYDPSSHAVERE